MAGPLARGAHVPLHLRSLEGLRGKRLLFVREKDPLEMRNLIGIPEHAQVEQKMEQRLQRWLADTEAIPSTLACACR